MVSRRLLPTGWTRNTRSCTQASPVGRNVWVTWTVHRAEAREYTGVEALFAIRLATILLEVVAGLLKD